MTSIGITSVPVDEGPERRAPILSARSWVFAALTILVGAVVAYLSAAGLWFIALVLLFALPGFVLLHRAPLVAIAIWLFIDPFVVQSGGAVRMIYWVVHRVMPVGVLAILVASGMLGIRSSRLSRLGVAEVIMAGYVVATALSITYTSDTQLATMWVLYDRVVIPMCLYLVVRLLRPTGEALSRVAPIVAFVLVTQVVIGMLSWAAPELVPSDWLGRAAERTTGSVRSPSVYGITVIAAGVYLLHIAASRSRRSDRVALRALFMLAIVMAVVTFTRGVWLAAALAVVVLAFVHAHQIRRVALVAIPIVLLAVTLGLAGGQITKIQDRLNSGDTALTRLPLAYASLEMFEQKPVTGWGYGNFDKYDREFQRSVGDFVPEKDHSSHNVYLTLLAEQGIIGATLFLGPAVWWLIKSGSGYKRLPRSGLVSRKLLVLLWTLLAAHFIVNNFSNMTVVFGLGQWWLILGLIASIVSETGRMTQPSTIRDMA